MSDEKIREISDRYIELYENITGKTFEKSDTSNLEGRIQKNVTDYLTSI
jgi:phosphoribosylaminoimidazole-succinocarboxamide synthase